MGTSRARMDDDPREVRVALRSDDAIETEAVVTEHLTEPERSYHARQIEAAAHLLRYSAIDIDERDNQYDTIEDHTHNLDAWRRMLEAENADLKASIRRIYDLLDLSILDTNSGKEWDRAFDACVEHDDFEKWRE